MKKQNLLNIKNIESFSESYLKNYFYFIFFKYDKVLENYISAKECSNYIKEFSFSNLFIFREYNEKSFGKDILGSYYIFKKGDNYLFLRIVKDDIFISVRFLKNNILYSYYLNSEKIEYLVYQLNSFKNQILKELNYNLEDFN